MKSSKLIMGCLATLGLAAGAASVQAEVDRDAIAERLKPVGELCLQGEECGTAAAAASDSGGDGAVDGEAIYGQVCMACHDSGAAGAPVRGEEDAWAERVDKGWDTLLDHAINGFNAMPARGGNPNLSDEEVAAATAHLVDPVMDVPELGGSEDEGAADEEAASDDAAAAAEGEAVTEEGPVEEDAEAAAVATEDAPADEEAVEEASTDEEAAGDEPAHAGIDGEAIYNQACMACHMTGAAGAPRRGEAGEWEGRIDQDIETLYDHAINGVGAMPPKGGNMGLSDDEVRAAVDFLVEPVK
ncbi:MULTISPECIES: c-type cytochrome [unclassified Halomonas]|uniref:c-type cytochrome n=1 Tax=unclassified Halomonas TaxID=2609666 RepID=UPI001F254900|nr:c-type cytochrome [Halomonas sp. SS10-MC5]